MGVKMIFRVINTQFSVMECMSPLLIFPMQCMTPFCFKFGFDNLDTKINAAQKDLKRL